jgi:hypothetical protein
MTKSRLAAAVWLVGMVAAGLQALALTSRYFQPWLTADYIYPQLVAEDVLAGRYPLAGWTLSSAPYFFPDLVMAIGLRAFGGPGTVLPGYVVFYYLALAVVAGWSLQRATATGWAAWLGGVVLVNGLLLWQSVGDHAHYLWLLGTPGFHGGVVLLGLAAFALWAGPAEHAPAHPRWALGVIFLGTISDTLFLTQCALPLGLGLWAQAGWNWRSPRVRAYATTLAVALGLVVLVRVGLAFGGWFNFSKVVRYVPTPAAVTMAAANFLGDVRLTLAPGAWAFFTLGGVALAGVGVFWWRERRQRSPRPPERQIALGFVLVGLAATTLLPIVTVYWRNATHVRYIQPWLVLPEWLALAWLLPKGSCGAGNWRTLAALGLILGGLGALAWPQIRRPALSWPYPASQAALDEFLRQRGLHYGLSDYWHAHEINTLAQTPVHLFPLRPDGRASFWNNNAFHFYTSGEGGALRTPDYTFVITNALDEAAVLRRFGEPATREEVGGLTVWLYAAPEARRLTESMQAEVREFLRGRPGEQRIAARP